MIQKDPKKKTVTPVSVCSIFLNPQANFSGSPTQYYYTVPNKVSAKWVDGDFLVINASIKYPIKWYFCYFHGGLVFNNNFSIFCRYCGKKKHKKAHTCSLLIETLYFTCIWVFGFLINSTELFPCFLLQISWKQ